MIAGAPETAQCGSVRRSHAMGKIRPTGRRSGGSATMSHHRPPSTRAVRGSLQEFAVTLPRFRVRSGQQADEQADLLEGMRRRRNRRDDRCEHRTEDLLGFVLGHEVDGALGRRVRAPSIRPVRRPLAPVGRPSRSGPVAAAPPRSGPARNHACSAVARAASISRAPTACARSRNTCPTGPSVISANPGPRTSSSGTVEPPSPTNGCGQAVPSRPLSPSPAAPARASTPGCGHRRARCRGPAR